MKYHQIIKQDTANGIGIRMSLFVSGCRLHCPECHNRKGQDFDFGYDLTETVVQEIFDEFRNVPVYDGLSILGGEPFEPENLQGVADICVRFKKEFPGKSLWVYTGKTYEKLCYLVNTNTRLSGALRDVLRSIDILVDGPFEIAQRSILLSYRGSANQRIIDMDATRATGRLTELKLDVRHADIKEI